MRMVPATIALGLILLGPGAVHSALADDAQMPNPLEAIDLKDGHRVVGTVVAEKPGALYVDLGFDVVKLPRDQIVARHSPDQGAPPPIGTAAEPASNGFYKQHGSATRRPIKELVQQFGEGVVSIETPSGLGSGFVVNDDGYVVTNNHVIEGETRISVVVYQGGSGGLTRKRINDVEIVALNPFVDLALLKLPPVENLKLTSEFLGNLEDLSVGDAVFAVGAPLGLERSVSQGILSTLNRNFDGLIYLQTDAAINPGNSGGPLFNMKGEVIGVTNMGFRGTDNLGFAIPISYVKDFLRNRDAFAFDKDNPNTGYRYLDPPRRLRPEQPSGASTSPKRDATGR